MVLVLASAQRTSVANMRNRSISRAPTSPFGEWLRVARGERGLTMEMLAERADTAAPVISNLERGTRNPSRDMVDRLAHALSPDDADERTFRALHTAGLKAAGFAAEGDSEGPVETITREAGYDPTELNDAEKDELHRGIRAFTRAWVDDRRKRTGRD